MRDANVQSLTIAECCEVLDHLRVPVNADERFERQGSVPYYGANGVQGYIDNWIFNEPLVLLAEDGGNFAEFATKPIAYRISGKSWVNNHAHVLRAKPGFDLNYIFRCLEHKDIQYYIAGGTRSKLNKSELLKIKIPVPVELSEQKRIAEIFDEVDRQIQVLDAHINKNKNLQRGIVLARFTERLGDAIDYPRSWGWMRLCDITVKISDRDHTTPFYTEDGVFIVSPTNFENDEGINWKSCKRISQSAHAINSRKTDITEGDLIYHRIGAGLGRVRYVKKDYPPFSILHSLALIRANTKKVNPLFLKWLLRSPIVEGQVKRDVQSIGVPDLGLDKISQFRVAIPTINEQVLIASALEALQERIEAFEQQRDMTTSLKQGLIQKLIGGMDA